MGTLSWHEMILNININNVTIAWKIWTLLSTTDWLANWLKECVCIH
jgi:hypothetical protein